MGNGGKQDSKLVDSHEVSVTKAVSPVKDHPASCPVNSFIMAAVNIYQHLNNVQNRWSTHFARLEALLTTKPRQELVWSCLGQALDEAQHGNIEMKSPLHDLYQEPSMDQEPVFFSRFCAPTGLGTEPEQDNRDDVSVGKFVSTMTFHGILTRFNLKNNLIVKLYVA